MNKAVIAIVSATVATTGFKAVAAETYRLVHAIGNDEKIVAMGLSKRECEAMKPDRVAIAEALGIHSEQLGIGSITCLPDSLFDH